MSNATIIDIAIILVLVVCQIFNQWYSTHKNKNTEWLKSIDDFTESYVHAFEQTDLDGHKKMENVVQAVVSTMKRKNKPISKEDEDLIRAIAQRAYDAMVNKDKTANSLNEIAKSTNDEDHSNDLVKSSFFEEDINNDEVQDLSKETNEQESTVVERQG